MKKEVREAKVKRSIFFGRFDESEKLVKEFMREFDWSMAELWMQLLDPTLDWNYSIQVTDSQRIAIRMEKMTIDIPAPTAQQDVRPLINLVFSHGIQQIATSPEHYMPFDVYKGSELVTKAIFAEFTAEMQEVLDRKGVYILVKQKKPNRKT